MSQSGILTVPTGGNIPTPVSVVNGGTGNSGHGETTINATQTVFGVVDGLTVGSYPLFTFPSRFNVTTVIFQPISIVGIPNFVSFQGSFGDNSPAFDNFENNLNFAGTNLYDLVYTTQFNFNNELGSIPAGGTFGFYVSSPVLGASVYSFRVYAQGFYY